MRLLRLIRVSSYPAIYDESYDAEAPKLKALKQIINLIDPKEKIIIWTNFVKTSNCILKELTSYGAVLINGEQEVEKEIKLLSGFKKIQRRILIATYGTAKEGLTLTVSNHAIFLRETLVYLIISNQDRIHRISQEKSQIFTIFLQNSAEDWLEALVHKRERSCICTRRHK